MSTNLKQLLSRPTSHRRNMTQRFCIESLENRAMFAGDFALAGHGFLNPEAPIVNLTAGVTLDSASGVLSIRGTTGIDNVSLRAEPGLVIVNFNASTTVWARSAIKSIDFAGYAGDDRIVNGTSLPMTAAGGAGHDWIYGGEGADRIWGGDGVDHLYGRGGKDEIRGQAGNDYLDGGNGDDFLTGGAGDDVLKGSNGNDTLGAYWQNGIWQDDPGNDKLFGGTGRDVLAGGFGDDRLMGESDIDDLWGDAGDDFLDGGADGVVDTLHGGAGSDTFKAEWFNCYLNQDSWADFVIGEDRKFDVPIDCGVSLEPATS